MIISSISVNSSHIAAVHGFILHVSTAADAVNRAVIFVRTAIDAVRTAADAVRTAVILINTAADVVNTAVIVVRTAADAVYSAVIFVRTAADGVYTAVIPVRKTQRHVTGRRHMTKKDAKPPVQSTSNPRTIPALTSPMQWQAAGAFRQSLQEVLAVSATASAPRGAHLPGCIGRMGG